MAGRPVPKLLLLIPMLLSTPGVARAGWTEHGTTISSVREMLPRLQAQMGAISRTGSADDAPVVLPEGATAGEAKSLASALLYSGLAVHGPAGALSLAAPDLTTERSRAQQRLRLARARAVSASEPGAILTGVVTLFGHALEGPYRIDRSGDGIEVNGVRVYPEPGIDFSGRRATAAEEEETAHIKRAMNAYQRDRARIGDAAARAALAADMRTLPGVRSVEWEGDETLAMTHTSGVVEELVFSDLRQSEPEPAAEQVARLDAMAASFGEILRGRGALVCGATYVTTIPGPDGAVFARRLREIRGSTEPEALKLARLQVWTAHRDAAADLLFAR